MFDQWINEVRETLGPPPRTFSRDDYPYLTPPYADWLKFTGPDLLMEQYHQHAFLFQKGAASWGALVQSNNMMFEPGKHNAHAALILFSPDEYFDGWPQELRTIAEEVYAYREDRPTAPELRALADELDNEAGRYGRRQLPPSLTKGRDVFMVDLMIHREHLPKGWLEGGIFPVVHHPKVWPSWIVPARFWPVGFADAWGEF